jgi:hypothetical protein
VSDLLGVLRAARKRIEDDWAQGAFCRSGLVCTAGAVLIEAGWDVEPTHATHPDKFAWWTEPALVLVAKELGFEEGAMDVPKWNDHPFRTKEEVLALVDRVIAKEEERTYGSPLPELPFGSARAGLADGLGNPGARAVVVTCNGSKEAVR